MKKLLTLEQFSNQKNYRTELIKEQRKLYINVFNQFEDIKPVIKEAIYLVESGAFDFSLDLLLEQELNEENLMQKMKQKFDAAVKIAKEKGKQVLTDAQENIIKLGGNIVNVIKLVIEKLKEWIGAAYEAAKAAYTNAAATSSEKIKKAVTNMKEETKNVLINDVKQMKSVTGAVASWMKSGLISSTSKAMVDASKQEESFEIEMYKSINEAIEKGQLDFTDLINEGDHGHGIPFVSAIAHKLHEIPPFNILDKVKQGAEKIAGGALAKFSYYATKIAEAPGPYEFVALAGIIGILVEVQVKGVAKHAILHAIPGLGLVLSIISNTAMVLAVIGIIETVMQKKEEESH